MTSTITNGGIALTSPLGQFGGVLVTEQTPLIELDSTWGISALRDITAVAGSATITHAGAGSGSEYVLATTASGTDSATLDSAERGRYQPGYGANAGIGIRLASATLSGSQTAKWGYFDDNNGYYFKLTSSGLSVCLLRAGVETAVARASWNGDKLDGTGESGLTLSLTAGNIYQIVFSWYGYGVIEFSAIVPDANNVQRTIVLHRADVVGATSVVSPNLPIRATIANGGTATAQTMYVAGRQYSQQGAYRPYFRTTSAYRLSLGSVGTTFLPVISFRRKSAFISARIRPAGYGILVSSADVLVQLRVNASLTSASYGTPNDTTAAETALEVDIAATAVSGGEKVYEAIHPSAAGVSREFGESTVAGIIVPSTQPITLCVRSVSGTATVSTVFRIQEEW